MRVWIIRLTDTENIFFMCIFINHRNVFDAFHSANSSSSDLRRQSLSPPSFLQEGPYHISSISEYAIRNKLSGDSNKTNTAHFPNSYPDQTFIPSLLLGTLYDFNNVFFTSTCKQIRLFCGGGRYQRIR